MDIDKLAAAVERFFLDIVGTLTPGALGLAGIYAATGPLHLGHVTCEIPSTTAGWVFVIALSYALGHAVAGVGENVVERSAAWLWAKVRRIKRPWSVVPDDVLFQKLAKGRKVLEFVRTLNGQDETDLTEEEVRHYRDVAMTIAKPADKATVVRFMFLSLLALGVATVLWVTGGALLVREVVEAVQDALSQGGSEVVYTIAFGALRGLGIVVLCVIVSAPFLERRFHFRSMSMGVPFSMALAEMREKHEPYAVEGPTQEGSRCARPLVYLAGGLHSGWQDRVMVQARECQYLDPREHGVKDPKGYTHWDLQAVRACDIVFAFLEATNPGGYALALEIGYAAALGKTIILVDEKSAADPAVARYLEMVREAATYKSSSLHDGIEHLRKWLMLVRR